MIQTSFGDHDGKSWERLCQAAFIIRHGDKYQRMPPSPGDFGIEGWTSDGLVFQCYCPERDYNQKDLHDAIQGKITKDIVKLKKYSAKIAEHIGAIKIQKWMFVTPAIEHSKLHAHARKKETEARTWNLPILADDFSIVLQDGQHYAVEFEKHRQLAGTIIPLGLGIDIEDVLPAAPEEFEQLIDRKNRVRLRDRASHPTFLDELKRMNEVTGTKFLKCDRHLSQIETHSPQVYKRVIRIVGQYALEMDELQHTWSAEPEALVKSVRSELGNRLEIELSKVMTANDARHIADLMVSRWLAVCQLDIRE